MQREKKVSRKTIITSASFTSPEEEKRYRIIEQTLNDIAQEKRRQVLNENRKKDT